MRGTILASITLALVLAQSVIPSTASTMTATIDNEKIHLKITSLVIQNFTHIESNGISLSDEDLSKARIAIENAIKTRQTGVEIKNLALSTTFLDDSIKVACEFDIYGAVMVEGAILKANSSWRAFEVLENISSRGVYWNSVGEAYFMPKVDYYADMAATQFYINRTQLIGTHQAKQVLRNLRMLDFKPLDRSLSRWDMVHSLRERKTRWLLKLGTVFDFCARKSTEPESVEYTIAKTLEAEISAPGYASLQRETIRTDLGTGIIELSMLAIVLLTTFAFLSTHLLSRRTRRL